MLFFLPFYRAIISNKQVKFNPIITVLLILFALFLSFNGPLIPATVLIVCPLFLAHRWWAFYYESSEEKFLSKISSATKRIPKQILFYCILFSLFCLYSLYIGRFNAENFNKPIPLLERYLLLPQGLYYQFTKSLGPPLLVIVTAINIILISKQKQNIEAKKLISTMKWIGIFSAIYIILLPFGGYREYRPYIIRWDTFMPVNLGLFYFYGISTLSLINHYSSKAKVAYLTLIIGFLSVFTFADKTDYNASTCEKESLKIISKSSEKIILLEKGCSIMAWGKITNYNDSKFNTQYLQLIGVIKEEKYYYQK